MSKNPYVEKFSKAFNYGLALVVFLVLVALTFFPRTANSLTQGDLPVLCFSAEEFAQEYQSKAFEIIGKSDVIIFVEGKPYKVVKLITMDDEGKVGTWLVEGDGKFCLLFLEKSGKLVSQ